MAPLASATTTRPMVVSWISVEGALIPPWSSLVGGLKPWPIWPIWLVLPYVLRRKYLSAIGKWVYFVCLLAHEVHRTGKFELRKWMLLISLNANGPRVHFLTWAMDHFDLTSGKIMVELTYSLSCSSFMQRRMIIIFAPSRNNYQDTCWVEKANKLRS